MRSSMNKVCYCLLFIFGCLVISSTIVRYSVNPLKKFDDIDTTNYIKFTTNLEIEVTNIINNNVSQFVDEMTSFEAVKISILDDKNKYAEKLWNKYFNDEIQKLINERVGILVVDLWNNNESLIRVIELDNKLVKVKGFDKNLRDDIFSTIKLKGIKLSTAAIDQAITNQVIALGTAAVAGAGVSKLLKSNLISLIVGIFVDYGVDHYLNTKIKKQFCENLSIQINDTIIKSFNEDDGFYDKINSEITSFHKKRNLYYIDNVYFPTICENLVIKCKYIYDASLPYLIFVRDVVYEFYKFLSGIVVDYINSNQKENNDTLKNT